MGRVVQAMEGLPLSERRKTGSQPLIINHQEGPGAKDLMLRLRLTQRYILYVQHKDI